MTPDLKALIERLEAEAAYRNTGISIVGDVCREAAQALRSSNKRVEERKAERDEARAIARKVPGLEFELSAARHEIEIANAHIDALTKRVEEAEGERDEAREEIKDAVDALVMAHSLQSFATGHGDTLTDLIMWLSIQSRDRAEASESRITALTASVREGVEVLEPFASLGDGVTIRPEGGWYRDDKFNKREVVTEISFADSAPFTRASATLTRMNSVLASVGEEGIGSSVDESAVSVKTTPPVPLSDEELKVALSREPVLAQLPALIMANIEDVLDWERNTALVTAHAHAYVLHQDLPDALTTPVPRPTAEPVAHLVAAYKAGFATSSEGWNGEYPDACETALYVDERARTYALAHPSSPPATEAGGEWRPISTAPKDGTKIDLWADRHRWADHYWVNSSLPGWCCQEIRNRRWTSVVRPDLNPTHWQPLPPPPIGSGEDQGASRADRAASPASGLTGPDGGLSDGLGARSIYSLLASAWFYGGWKAETAAEHQMQAIMEQQGWWPILNEGVLMTKLGTEILASIPAERRVDDQRGPQDPRRLATEEAPESPPQTHAPTQGVDGKERG